MKKVMICLAVALVATAACNKKQEVKRVYQDPIRISAEDSAEFISVLKDYLDVARERTDSVAETMGQLEQEMLSSAGGATDEYMSGKVHVDSVLNHGIELVHEGRYSLLLDLLEKEQMNIWTYPGNVMENELGMALMVETLLEQKCGSNSSKEFLSGIVKWFELLAVHMELLEMLGNGEHEYYGRTLEALDFIYYRLGDTEKEQEINNKLKARERSATQE